MKYVCSISKIFLKFSTFDQWCESDVVVQELPPLHDQEGEVVRWVVHVGYDRGRHRPGRGEEDLVQPRVVAGRQGPPGDGHP